MSTLLQQAPHRQGEPCEGLDVWRDGYRLHLISRSVPPTQAADIAAKIAYRPDLYPSAGAVEGCAEDSPFARADRSAAQGQRPGKHVSARTQKLIDLGCTIAQNPPKGGDILFSHAVFCQVGLPRKQVAGREFMRQSGSAWLSVQAGWLDEGHGPVAQPLPYGALPRLALAWVSTQALRDRSREVKIGNSASEFLRMLGKPTTGGPRGAFRTLRTQMHALAACRLQIGFKGRTFNGQPVEQFDAWQDSKDDRQHALWPGVLVLSECYYSALVDSAVPMDYRALRGLGDSALKLDIYSWLTHRLHRVEGRGTAISWLALRDQFGQEYQGKNASKDFRKTFVDALQKVQEVYPAARVKIVDRGLHLMPSPPPVPYRP